MSKKTVFALIIVIALIGGGAYFVNSSSLIGNTTNRPTATLIALESSPTLSPTSLPTTTLIPRPSATATPTHLPVSPTPLPPTPTRELAAINSSTVPTTAPSSAAAVNTPTPEPSGYNGEWYYNFGSMTLSQNVNSLAGTYHGFNSDFGGEVSGYLIPETNQFNGLWVSHADPVVQGFLNWRFAPDGNSFSGTFEYRSFRGPWCGARVGQPLPPGCGFSGNWQLYLGWPGGSLGEATLSQTGAQVQGQFTTADGRSGEIREATVSQNSLTEATLRGTWADSTGSSGPFEWRLNLTTGQSFTGYRTDINSEWCGWRNGAERPAPCGTENLGPS